jgi:Mitochondrial export protein Som1
MAPPVEAWSARELPDRVQVNMKGRRRKGNIELSRCELFELVQFECTVLDGVKSREAPVVCRPIERLFRR